MNMKTDPKAILHLESDVSELYQMGKVLGIVLQGDIGKSPTDGIVHVSDDDATALYWIGNEICRQIEKLDKAYYEALGKVKADAVDADAKGKANVF